MHTQLTAEASTDRNMNSDSPFYGQVTHHATLDISSGLEVQGCPLGRGANAKEALADLERRIRAENPGLKFTLKYA